METCSRCHGDFEKTGPKAYDLVHFPNKLVDHEELGTDPLRITGVFDMDAEEKKRFLSGKVTTTPIGARRNSGKPCDRRWRT